MNSKFLGFFGQLTKHSVVQVFAILEKDYGIVPVMSGTEMAECEEPDQLAMVSYLSQVYEIFKGEIPYVGKFLTFLRNAFPS